MGARVGCGGGGGCPPAPPLATTLIGTRIYIICSADITTFIGWQYHGYTSAGGGGGGVLFDNNGPNASDGTGGIYAGRGGVGYGAGGGGGSLKETNVGPYYYDLWPGGTGAPGFVYVEWG